MRCAKVLCLLVLVRVFVGLAPGADAKRPMVIDDLFRFQRVADPQISPDGTLVAYTLTTVDLAGNKTTTNIWLAPATEGKPRQLTGSAKHDRHPRWSPDGKQILFESDRSGENQLWIIDVSGGEARQLTTIATEASNALWSRDGKTIAFVSAVWPEHSGKPYAESNALNKKRIDEKAQNPVKARVFNKLFFRHWNEWVEDKRQHLFVLPAAGGEPRDVTPGDRDAHPTSDTFATGENFTFSPDSKYLVYTAVPAQHEAWSTNYDICRVPVAGGTALCLTKDNSAGDSGPVFSPDGSKLAYRAQRRPGFEADKWEIMVVDSDASGAWRGQPRSVTAKLAKDLSADEYAWAGNASLIFTADEQARKPLFQIYLDATDSGVVTQGGHGTASALSTSRDGKSIAYLSAKLDQPNEAMVAETDLRSAVARDVSHANDMLLASLDSARPESVAVVGAAGTPMHMWILKPPGFDANKKWPLAFLVHGGPQGAWEDGWSYRWNPELWAAQGYVVALPNPRGSTGFGQK
ncbi:MAG TPA: prolyl oligopeptidase family serine peptidase, partial [Gemmataceae bacterium]|nr:prolyl oligopeptidase family serine peptidase [Gemmataceae bacterium]